MKTKTPEHAHRARERHHAALASLHATPETANGLTIWRALCKVERDAHAAATAQCNGERYNGQPYRDEDEWDAFVETIAARVSRAFGGTLPDGFMINGDPRGYTLKIRGESAGEPGAHIPEGMARDWGSNGILAWREGE